MKNNRVHQLPHLFAHYEAFWEWLMWKHYIDTKINVTPKCYKQISGTKFKDF